MTKNKWQISLLASAAAFAALVAFSPVLAGDDVAQTETTATPQAVEESAPSAAGCCRHHGDGKVDATAECPHHARMHAEGGDVAECPHHAKMHAGEAADCPKHAAMHGKDPAAAEGECPHAMAENGEPAGHGTVGKGCCAHAKSAAAMNPADCPHHPKAAPGTAPAAEPTPEPTPEATPEPTPEAAPAPQS